MQTANFSPNNNEASKILFTGRTEDVSMIFEHLLKGGKCLAIYGERRIGKTLTLEIIELIINGGIDLLTEKLIDIRFKTEIQVWKSQYNNFDKYKVFYLSLQGISSSAELAQMFLKKSKNIGLLNNLSVDIPTSTQLISILDELQLQLCQNKIKLVVLIDEMENLEEFKDEKGNSISGTIAALFCNRIDYSSIIFVHTGSYLWQERVSIPGSNFTHLAIHYLTSVNLKDLRDFLLQDILPEAKKDSIIRISGGKPLCVQWLGEIHKKGNSIDIKDLLKDHNLETYIEKSVYEEKNLDFQSKNILIAIAHHPNISSKWLSKKLQIDHTIVGKKLYRLASFGTIKQEGNKYKIIGELIEKYGKDNCLDITQKDVRKKLLSMGRYGLGGMIIALTGGYLHYTNPSTKVESFSWNNKVISLTVPSSLEVDEQGKLSVKIENNTNAKIKSLKIYFQSKYIEYVKNKKNNYIKIADIEEGSIFEEVEYKVIENTSNYLESKVIIEELSKKEFEYKIALRPYPLKKYVNFLIAISSGALIAVIKPEWVKFILTLFISAVQPKANEKTPENKKAKSDNDS